MIALNLISNIIIFFGITGLGFYICKLLKIEKISGLNFFPIGGYSLLGFSIISILLYATTLLNFAIIQITLLINILITIFAVSYLYNFKIQYFVSFIEKDKYNKFFLFILFIFLLFSLMPTTDADSLAYHLNIPKNIIENKKLIYSGLHFHEVFYGTGEAFFLTGLLLDNYQIGRLVNFIGYFSIFSIIYTSISKSKKLKKSNIILLIILCTPVLFQLFDSSKPQLIFVAINFLVFFLIFEIKPKSSNSTNIFLLISILLVCSFLGKIVFLVPCLMLITYFFIKNFNFISKKILFFIVFYLLFLTLIFFAKYQIYGNHSLYFLSIIQEENSSFDLFIKSLRQSNQLNYFPFSLFVPLSKIDILGNLGYFALFFLLIKVKKFNLEKVIIFSIFLIYMLLGFRHARFFLEPYLFYIYIFIKSNYSINKFDNINLKFLAIPQIIFMCLIYIYLSLNLNIIFDSKSRSDYLNNYSYGYQIHEFLNRKIKDKSNILINQRTLFYSKHNIVYTEFLKFKSVIDKNTLDKLTSFNPEFLVDINNTSYLKKCRSKLLFKENVTMYKSKNLLKSNFPKIPVYVYKINKKVWPGCLD